MSCGCGGCSKGYPCGCGDCWKPEFERAPYRDPLELLVKAGSSEFPTQHSYPRDFSRGSRGWSPADAFGYTATEFGGGGGAANGPIPGFPKLSNTASGPGGGPEDFGCVLPNPYGHGGGKPVAGGDKKAGSDGGDLSSGGGDPKAPVITEPTRGVGVINEPGGGRAGSNPPVGKSPGRSSGGTYAQPLPVPGGETGAGPVCPPPGEPREECCVTIMCYPLMAGLTWPNGKPIPRNRLPMHCLFYAEECNGKLHTYEVMPGGIVPDVPPVPIAAGPRIMFVPRDKKTGKPAHYRTEKPQWMSKRFCAPCPLVGEQDDLCKCAVEASKAYAGLGLKYDASCPNSNTYVAALAKACGMPVTLPQKATGGNPRLCRGSVKRELDKFHEKFRKSWERR